MSMKDWKTDIRIKLPRLHIIRPKHYDIVAEDIIKQCLKLAFWFSWMIPFGAWKIYDLIKG